MKLSCKGWGPRVGRPLYPALRSLPVHIVTPRTRSPAQQSTFKIGSVVQPLQCTTESNNATGAVGKEWLDVWNNAQAVCFDVDSTLCEDESIDELAAYLGVGEAVAAVTSRAMGGYVEFEVALAERLSIMKPSRKNVTDFLASHPPRFSKGIPELILKLQQKNTSIFLISGGFRAIINPIADLLGIPLDHVFANKVLFKEDGSYAGFDPAEFTSRSGGKARAIQAIKEKYGYSPLVMIGDGATDLEARTLGAADMFIGYGGSVLRPTIEKAADWYVYTIDELTGALDVSETES